MPPLQSYTVMQPDGAGPTQGGFVGNMCAAATGSVLGHPMAYVLWGSESAAGIEGSTYKANRTNKNKNNDAKPLLPQLQAQAAATPPPPPPLPSSAVLSRDSSFSAPSNNDSIVSNNSSIISTITNPTNGSATRIVLQKTASSNKQNNNCGPQLKSFEQCLETQGHDMHNCMTSWEQFRVCRDNFE